MTINLSIQTNANWKSHKPRRYYDTLPRPVVPLTRDYEEMTQIISHQHTWSQLAYSCAGVMHIETDSGIFVLPPEQALWIPPNTRHQHFCKNKVSYRSLHIDAALSRELGDKVRPLNVDSLLKSLILEITSWPKDYAETEQTQRFILVLLDRLAVAKSNQLFMPTPQDRRLFPIIETLNDNPANKLTIEDWARTVGASSRTLNRLFNQNYGMGFSRWKQKLRILKSIELLSSNTSLVNIAYELGYESTSSFITGFKKQLGCSPKKYLANEKKTDVL
ncbi:helix-turn-helix transcriptional regulator [Alteromonas sp. 5E99-2]|uniref:AraC family transcriptional regulator n=1 Tax=Alteromonas sp. 5E99-2 TaxID=2817683 RepID=UPI001A994518|nr:helix-turn-helix transcriptional regulator [Alteromonas sp. 5E99-2]MBO1255005.1 helix-turn-helix transcriptional regulator [Alteromonas sp. 5E99-2]